MEKQPRHPNRILETERLFLREMNEEDFPVLCRMLQDSCVMVAWERTFSDDEVVEWIISNISRYRTAG